MKNRLVDLDSSAVKVLNTLHQLIAPEGRGSSFKV